MACRCSRSTRVFLPFLYPSLFAPNGLSRARLAVKTKVNGTRHSSTDATTTPPELPTSRLNPAPDDYSMPSFADKAKLTLRPGRGGHGCISFLREAYVEEGPANGGDGGRGGNIYIQAVHGETSLFKLARKKVVQAGHGKSGMGSARAGPRGDDVVISVPVGTVVRELSRDDPEAEARFLRKLERKRRRKMEAEASKPVPVEEGPEDQLVEDADGELVEDVDGELVEDVDGELVEDADGELVEDADGEPVEDPETESRFSRKEEKKRRRRRRKQSSEPVSVEEGPDGEPIEDPDRHNWVLYPGISSSDRRRIDLPRMPNRDRLFQQPEGPITLDLSRPTPQPILLAVGGLGGLGNPHFVGRRSPKPMFATKGEVAMTMEIELELKLLADIGLVGLPNAGKSTLLRSISNSRTRVGNWAFTTLQPNVGTVVLDNNKGRPTLTSYRRVKERTLGDDPYSFPPTPQPEFERRTRFTIADIPGLVEGAHLDKGLGIAFLRHVERAGVLAFVLDLSASNAVQALKALWHEVGLYAQMREEEERQRQRQAAIDWSAAAGTDPADTTFWPSTMADDGTVPEGGLHIAGKPWFVVATKGDLPGTQENFAELREYLAAVGRGDEPHPSGVEGAWIDDCMAIPVSAINGQGVDRVVHWAVGLLDG